MAVNILVIFAHPLFERSRANKELVNNIPLSDHITFHDLYELYPDFNIDIAEEQRLLQTHDIIIWHHPFYWYSCPPLLKQWIDMVFEAGWAYGPGGKALEGKRLLQVITTGGPSFAYQPEGNNKHTIHTFLSPFRQTAELCHMTYMPPFVVHGTHRLTTEEMKDFGAQYKMLFHRLLTGEAIDIPYSDEKYMNHWLKKTSTP